MKRIHLLVALAGLALALPLAATSSHRFPDRIDLPNGWQPEGIAVGRGTNVYVGSIPTGRVWRGDLRTGEGAELVPNRGRRAIGVEVDRRNRLWVAGGPTGDGYVYNARTGADIAQFNFTDESATFVNDVVVTRRAAWFTDSQRQFLYKVPIGHNGRIGTPRAVPLTGDIQYEAGFNVNGIDATRNGKTLVIVQSNTGELFKVNRRGRAREIDLGGATVNGDGLLLDGRTLYAVVRTPGDGVVVIRLRHDLRSGTVRRTITSDDFAGPTTVDDFGHRLYVVNARFGPPPPPTEFWVTQVSKRRR
jgi:sugar lactone lactonase YvrE